MGLEIGVATGPDGGVCVAGLGCYCARCVCVQFDGVLMCEVCMYVCIGEARRGGAGYSFYVYVCIIRTWMIAVPTCCGWAPGMYMSRVYFLLH